MHTKIRNSIRKLNTETGLKDQFEDFVDFLPRSLDQNVFCVERKNLRQFNSDEKTLKLEYFIVKMVSKFSR